MDTPTIKPCCCPCFNIRFDLIDYPNTQFVVQDGSFHQGYQATVLKHSIKQTYASLTEIIDTNDSLYVWQKCLICNHYVYAVDKDIKSHYPLLIPIDDQLIITQHVLVDYTHTPNQVTAHPQYSSLYKVILPKLSPLSVPQPKHEFDPLYMALDKIYSDYMSLQLKEMESRIKLFQDEQHVMFEILLSELAQHRDTLFQCSQSRNPNQEEKGDIQLVQLPAPSAFTTGSNSVLDFQPTTTTNLDQWDIFPTSTSPPTILSLPQSPNIELPPHYSSSSTKSIPIPISPSSYTILPSPNVTRSFAIEFEPNTLLCQVGSTFPPHEYLSKTVNASFIVGSKPATSRRGFFSSVRE